MKKQPVIWVVENEDENGKWDVVNNKNYYSRSDALDECSYWRRNAPEFKYRVAAYVRRDA